MYLYSKTVGDSFNYEIVAFVGDLDLHSDPHRCRFDDIHPNDETQPIKKEDFKYNSLLYSYQSCQ